MTTKQARCGCVSGGGERGSFALLVGLGALLVAGGSTAGAAVVRGGGARSTDCVVVVDAGAANQPAPPREPRAVDCTDGDPGCDADGTRNAQCRFDLRLCVNSTAIAGCTPGRADSLAVEHAQDDGDPRFDTDFQALQLRTAGLGFPDNDSPDDCTLPSAVTVELRAPASQGRPWRSGSKRLRYAATGAASGRAATDRDRMRLTCRPEGDGLYAPRDLYTGTFDRIARQVFAQSCALSSCHDSESHQANMILLPGAAYSQIVNVVPWTFVAAQDGLLRVFPGDETRSLLYLKVHERPLPVAYGPPMPLGRPDLAAELQEIIRLWILGDAVVPPASATGWVEGTDQ